MIINVTARGTRVQDSFREMLENKLARFDRFFNEETTADVTVTNKGHRETVEVTIRGAGMVFRSEQTTDDRQDSLDACVDALFRQITRHKDKLSTRLHHEAFEFRQELENDFLADVGGKEETVEDEFKIVRTKRFLMKPMSVEEAILQMNLVGHQFFMFHNADSDLISVVYQRDDGGYGLIEPDF